MDLQTLEISPEEAQARLAEYEAQVTSERTVEDDAIRAGYRAAKRGRQVIVLPEVIAAGGSFPSGLPRLAVIRADATECWVRVEGHVRDSRAEVMFCSMERDRGNARVGAHRVQVSVPRPDGVEGWPYPRGRTIVPTVPPQHRPPARRLHRFHILWEVEAWDPTPPEDPALIRHIRGDLWAVHAMWDLTPLERAVLAARSTA